MLFLQLPLFCFLHKATDIFYPSYKMDVTFLPLRKHMEALKNQEALSVLQREAKITLFPLPTWQLSISIFSKRTVDLHTSHETVFKCDCLKAK